MPLCHFCGAEMQQGWKACPMCGNRVEGDHGASVNITDAVVKEVRQSQTVDRSVQVVGDAEMYLRLGDAAYESGEHQRAIEHYDEAIRLNPQDAMAFNNRGMAYGRLGQSKRAIQDFNEAIRLNPQYAYFYYLRGLVYGELGKAKEAERDFTKAKELGYEP